jgi:hypothetical protein
MSDINDCPQCRADEQAIGKLVTGEVIEGSDPIVAARAAFCVLSGCLVVMHADHREALIAEFPEALAATIDMHVKSRQ